MKAATMLRWIGVLGLAVVAMYAWSARPIGLPERAERAALAGGAASADFGKSRPGVREDAVCGTVDGKRAIYRELGGLSVDDNSATWTALFRGWCA